MVKIIITLALSFFFMNGRLFAEHTKLARLHYDGGGDWYNDTDILPNIAEYLNRTIKTDFSLEQAIVKPADVQINDYPFIFLTGHGNINFSDKDVDNLRQYLLRGGFLYADDDYGMDSSFRVQIRKIFPEKEMMELPANHELFSSFFQFPHGLPKIHKHDDMRPQAFAIFDEYGRMMMLYTYETNISDGWSNVHDDPATIRENAFRMGANIFYYLLTQ
ncbi:MAG: DUF4159 domain-containing protein [Candidatus Cloacimonetes bacterium]|nr:DUF4159 domain-containing protein [Candidatus Cloacimonadota bacterium]